MIGLRVVLMATALLLLSSCETSGYRYGGSSMGAGYYYGSSWNDPYYSRRCCYYPSRPPAYRPPSAGPGRPVNLPSRPMRPVNLPARAPSRPTPSLRR
jgi:hypothetical protein